MGGMENREREIQRIGDFTLSINLERDQYGYLLFVTRKAGEIWDVLAAESDSFGYRLARGNLRRYARELLS